MHLCSDTGGKVNTQRSFRNSNLDCKICFTTSLQLNHFATLNFLKFATPTVVTNFLRYILLGKFGHSYNRWEV